MKSLKYLYIIIRTDGRPYSLQSDRNLFDDGWHALAKEFNLNWAFVQQWIGNKHQSTVHNRTKDK